MSSLQSSLGGDGWGADGFQWPEWLDGYDDPVVRSFRSSRKRMHAPDLSSEDARPACRVGNRDDVKWTVDEMEHIEDFWSQCTRDECADWFGGEE